MYGTPGIGLYSTGWPAQPGDQLPPPNDPWWKDGAEWLWNKTKSGGSSGSFPDLPTYYASILAGIVPCPGPLTISLVANLLETLTPEEVSSLRSVVFQSDTRWGNYSRLPETTQEIAAAIVAEIHGGRDCTPGDVYSLAVFEALRRLAPAGSIPPADGTAPYFPPMPDAAPRPTERWKPPRNSPGRS